MKISIVILFIILPLTLSGESRYETGISGFYENISLHESAGKSSMSSPFFFQYEESKRSSFGLSFHFYRIFPLSGTVYLNTGPAVSYSAQIVKDPLPDDFGVMGQDVLEGTFDYKFIYEPHNFAAPYFIMRTGVSRISTQWMVQSLNIRYIEQLYGFLFTAGEGLEIRYSNMMHIFAQGLMNYRLLSPSVSGPNDKYIRDGNNLSGIGWRLECGVNVFL